MQILLVATYELGHQPLQPRRGGGAPARAATTCVRSTSRSTPGIPALVDVGRRGRVLGADAHRHPPRPRPRAATRSTGPVRAFGLYAAQCTDFATPVEWDAAAARPATCCRRSTATPASSRTASSGSSVRSWRSTAARTGAGTARCRSCYDGRVRVSTTTRCSPTSRSWSGRRAATSPSAIPTSSTRRRTRAGSSRRCTTRFPDVTFDCTVKVEHVLRHADLWPELAASGCLFVVSAFESVDDAVLDRLDKGHTAADAARAVACCATPASRSGRRGCRSRRGPRSRRRGAARLRRTTTTSSATSTRCSTAIRLLLPEGSLLLDHPDLGRTSVRGTPSRSTYAWASADPAVDELQQRSRRSSRPTAMRARPLRARSGPRPARRPSTSRTPPTAARASPRAGSAAPSRPSSSSSRSGRQRGVVRNSLLAPAQAPCACTRACAGASTGLRNEQRARWAARAELAMDVTGHRVVWSAHVRRCRLPPHGAALRDALRTTPPRAACR